MVDEARVARLLRSMSDDLRFLHDVGRPDPADPVVMRATKYAFVTAIEAAIDVAHHICATEGWGPPDTNAEALVLLGHHRVIATASATEMASASGFRNVLVHDYVRVDDARVIEQLDHLGVFESFVSEVARWVRSGA